MGVPVGRGLWGDGHMGSTHKETQGTACQEEVACFQRAPWRLSWEEDREEPGDNVMCVPQRGATVYEVQPIRRTPRALPPPIITPASSSALSFGTVGPQSQRNEAVGSGVRGLRGASRVRGWRQGLVLGVCLLWQWCPELRRAVTWPHLPCAPGERPRPFSWLGSGPVELS